MLCCECLKNYNRKITPQKMLAKLYLIVSNKDTGKPQASPPTNFDTCIYGKADIFLDSEICEFPLSFFSIKCFATSTSEAIFGFVTFLILFIKIENFPRNDLVLFG